MLTALISSTAPLRGIKDSASRDQHVSFTVRELAIQVAEELRGQLARSMYISFEQQLKRQELRLLAALAPGCNCSGGDTRNVASTGLLFTGQRDKAAPMKLRASTSDDMQQWLRNTSKQSYGQKSCPDKRSTWQVPSKITSTLQATRKPRGHCQACSSADGAHHGQSHSSADEKRWLPWRHVNVDFPRTTTPSGVRSLGDARDSELLAEVRGIRDVAKVGTSSSGKSCPTKTTDVQRSQTSPSITMLCPLGMPSGDSMSSRPTDTKHNVAPRSETHPTSSKYTISSSTDEETPSSPEKDTSDESIHGHEVRVIFGEHPVFGRSSHTYEKKRKVAKEVLAAAEPPPSPVPTLPLVPSGEIKMSGGMHEHQQLSKRCNPPGNTTPKAGDGLDSLEDQPPMSEIGRGIPSLPGEVQMSQHGAMHDGLRRRPEQPANASPMDAAAAEDQPQDLSSRHTWPVQTMPPMQCLEAEHGGPADVATTSHTVIGPAHQEEPPAAAAMGGGLKGRLRPWNSCSLPMPHLRGRGRATGSATTVRQQSRVSWAHGACKPTCSGAGQRNSVSMASTLEDDGRDADVSLAHLRQASTSSNGSCQSLSRSSNLTPQRVGIPESRAEEPSRPNLRRALNPKNFSSDTHAVRLEREAELLGEFMPAVLPSQSEVSSRRTSRSSEAASPASALEAGSEVQKLGSPLLLRLCGILPWGRLQVAYRYSIMLLAVSLVAVMGEQFYRAQSHIASPADCPWGVCMHFGYLKDLVLATGSILGLLSMTTLTSSRLLGGPTALLVRYAVEQDVVHKWSVATSWQFLYLTILWMSSLAFRASTMSSHPDLREMVRAFTYVLVSIIFMCLAFGILHISCIICILIDSYVLSVKETIDLAKAIKAWDKLGALLRRVSRAVDRGFLLVQTTAVMVFMCSFSDLMLQGVQQIWSFISDVLLAQSLVLIFSKAAEVTELCTRVPSLINSLEFGGNGFSQERHYLVEHITYSAAGFYVGEVRLTAAMALKLMHISILVAFGVLTKLTTA